MFPLVCVLILSSFVSFNSASLYDYSDDKSSLGNVQIPQQFDTHGDGGNNEDYLSSIGKLSSGIKLDSSAGYGSGFGYSENLGVLSAKPLQSEDLSLPALDLTKYSTGDVSSLQSLSHGSGLLSGFGADTNQHGTLDSLSALHHASYDGLHDIKEVSSSTGNEDHVKSLLLSTASVTSGTGKGSVQSLHSNIDSHSTLSDHISSVPLTGDSHETEGHSYFSSIIKAFSHGWSALFSH